MLYEVVLKPVGEIYPAHLRCEQITDYLAKLKVTPFEGEIPPNCVLLTSDTPAWHEDKALGKPKDVADAFMMLRSLLDKAREVITSVRFTTNDARGTRHYVTKVTFRGFTDKEITHYIKEHKPLDKTGAYGIQEWIRHIGATSTEDLYNNVMELSTHLICQFVN